MDFVHSDKAIQDFLQVLFLQDIDAFILHLALKFGVEQPFEFIQVLAII
jgi:hypothetical protein